MPSVSQAQHKLIATKAAEGEEWAKEWLKKDRNWRNLPRKKVKNESDYGLGDCCKEPSDLCRTCGKDLKTCQCQFTTKLDDALGTKTIAQEGASLGPSQASTGPSKGSVHTNQAQSNAKARSSISPK